MNLNISKFYFYFFPRSAIKHRNVSRNIHSSREFGVSGKRVRNPKMGDSVRPGTAVGKIFLEDIGLRLSGRGEQNNGDDERRIHPGECVARWYRNLEEQAFRHRAKMA